MNAPTLSPPPGRAIALLAKDHAGMRVDYQGLLKQSRDSLTREEPALAEMLRQFESHIPQLGRRWYAGDTSAVDEFLQLYCVEHDARTQLLKQAGAHATEIGRAPVCTPVTNAHLVCRLLLEKTKTITH